MQTRLGLRTLGEYGSSKIDRHPNNGILETPDLTLSLRLHGNKVRIERWNF